MEKNMELINIYLKIHQKKDLSFDDLKYLAQFDPECFEKTCHNVVYNIPQAKPVLLPEMKYDKKTELEAEKSTQKERTFVDQILEKLKHLERKQIPPMEVETERVKNLLGSLYMELLFPHNDKDTFFAPDHEEKGARFDKKA